MTKILGLDLGTNSIGWAVVCLDKWKILGTGVRIFPEGVENLGQGEKEKSKNATRREHRQTRRQYFRKRLRKIKLLELLIAHQMCPLTHEELKSWESYDKSKGKAGIKFPRTETFKEWLSLNPYQLCAEGLERQLALKEFGRILYHFIQRRGFWSNRKVKEEGALSKGSENKNIVGIKDAKEKVGDDKEYPTLGAYLYDISPKHEEPFKRVLEDGNELRVRARYTLRQMYVDEFEALWKKQAEYLGLNKETEKIRKDYNIGNPYREGKKENGLKQRLQHRIDYLQDKNVKVDLRIDEKNLFNTKLITEKVVSLKEILAGGETVKQEDSILFYQRPLRIQRHLQDECSFEQTIWEQNGELIYQRQKPCSEAKLIYAGKKPSPVSHPLAELRRAYEFINNIEYGERTRLNEEQREKILKLINSKSSNFKFQIIPKELNLEYEKFNYDNDHDVPANYTHAKVKPLFTDEVWNLHAHKIWHDFYSYDDNDKLIAKLSERYGFKEKNADKIEEAVKGKLKEDGTRIGGINLKDGFSNLSLKAIKNILPFLEDGKRYSEAVLLGGVKNIFGKKWNEAETIKIQKEVEEQIKNINKVKSNKEGEAIEKIKNYLKSQFNFDDNALLGLYHHSQDTEKQEMQEKLGEVENLRNPLVQQALYELKGLVTELSEEYLNNGERFNQIKVEMARDLKQSRQKRIDQWKINREREKENNEARERLTEYGLAHSRTNIHKYLLWKELNDETGNAICPYTGVTISIADLFNDNKFQIEHIIPYSKSLDDSFANKTICEANENREKSEQTPFQFYGSSKDKWEEIRQRAFKVLPYQKAKRFSSTTAHETDFINRQLNDTRYISRQAKDYLKQICSDVRVFPGQLTADLRRKWGLNQILNPPIQVSEDVGFGKVWAKVNSNGEAMAFYPIFNKPPQHEKGEFIITGEIKKGTFSSKYLSLSFPSSVQQDGYYWAKIKVGEQPLRIVEVLKPKPLTGENEILLYGKTDKKGLFDSKLLNQKLKAEELEDETSYWAKLEILTEKTEFFNLREKKKTPKMKKNNVLLYGKVKDGQFKSKIYTCRADVDDGKYTTLLEVDLDSITFHKAINDKPELKNNQVRLAGKVKAGSFQANIDRRFHYDVDVSSEGLHWVIFEIRSNPEDFTITENSKHKIDDGELMEGTIAMAKVIEADHDTGEILNEEPKKYFFPSKDRGDHRHHAIDAIVVAMTEQDYLRQLSTYNANKKEKKRGNKFDKTELYFPMPWEGFNEDVKKHIDQILISHKKVSRVLSKQKSKDTKTGDVIEGIGARGQLHKEFVFGKRKAPKKKTAYHIRKSLNDIKNNRHIEKIVDPRIKELILVHLTQNYPDLNTSDNFTIPADAFFAPDENGVKQPRVFLPNKNGEPVPIKKVRIRERIGGAEKLKSTNQYVNPRNNHHVLIYIDKEDNLKEEVVTFWTAVERKKQGQAAIQLPEDGKEIVTTMQINDAFLLGVSEESINWTDQVNLSKKLYKVQKLAGGSYFMELCFRHHLDARPDKEAKRDYKYIKGFGDGKTGWNTLNPLKVKISRTGKIIPANKNFCTQE